MSATIDSTIRVAIVTGAAQGIGLSIALRLADDGLDVAVNDIASKEDALREVVAIIEAKGRRAVAVPADISKEAEVIAMVEKVAETLGSVDVMVANAGIAVLQPLLETTVDDWDRVMSVNAKGVMLSYKHAAKQMIKQGRGGRLIGASSTAGVQAMTNLVAYTASKFAVRGLTQSAALELAQYGISVNAYAPGMIRTPLAKHPNDITNGGDTSTVKKILGVPDSPDAEPEVVASLVSYLAKPESYFITGQTYMVNGGVTLS